MFRRLFGAIGIAGLLAFVSPALLADDDAKKDTKKADKPTIVVFKLDGAVTEQVAGEGLLSGALPENLKELVEKMNKAANDANVKAVVILADGAQVGHAQKEELRQAMAKLRAAGKEIYAHSDS